MAGFTAIYVDADTFTVVRDKTADFIVGRRVKANCGADGYKYGTVESSSYSSPDTTVNLVSTNDDLTSKLAEVWYSSVKPGTKGNVAEHPHDDFEGSGAGLSKSYFYPDYNETDQGATGDGLSIKALVDIIDTDTATIVLRHNSGGATTSYTLTTSETIPSHITLEIENGAILDGAGTLTINGPFESGLSQAFGSSITVEGLGGKFVHVEWFGESGTFAAVAAAWQASKKLILEPSAVYEVTSELQATEEDVYIAGSGAKFLQTTASINVFNIIGTWGTTVSVSNINEDRTEITVPDASIFSLADVVKIGSDEGHGSFHPTETTHQRGEFTIIIDVDTETDILTVKKLFLAYDTAENTVIAKISDVDVKFENLVFEHDWETIGQGSYPFITLMGLKFADLRDIKIPLTATHALWAFSNYGSTFDNIKVGYADDEKLPEGQKSYGLFLVNCENCIVTRIIGNYCRHVVELIGSVGSSSGMNEYGFSRNNIISNIIGNACTESSIGIHHGTINNIFYNCISKNSLSGYGCRGWGNQYINCSSFNDGVGFNVFIQTGHTGSDYPTKDIVIKNPTIINPSIYAIQINTMDHEAEFYLQGGYVEGIAPLRFRGCRVHINSGFTFVLNGRMTVKGIIEHSGAVSDGTYEGLIINGMNIYATPIGFMSAATTYIIGTTTAGRVFDINNLYVGIPTDADAPLDYLLEDIGTKDAIRIRNVVLTGSHGVAERILKNTTDADAVTAEYIQGPIYVGDAKILMKAVVQN